MQKVWNTFMLCHLSATIHRIFRARKLPMKIHVKRLPLTINPFTFFDGLYSWPRFIITFSTRDNPHFFDLCSDEISPRATRGQGSVCPCVSLQIMNYDLPWSRLKTMEDAARDEANQSPGSGVTNVNKSDSWINIIGPRGRGEEVE